MKGFVVEKFNTAVLISMLLMLTACVPGGAPTELKFEAEVGAPVVPKGEVEIKNKVQSLEAFKQTVYPIVRSNTCINCHSSQTRGQAPTFADGNAEVAFDAITLSRKVDLVTPESSRIVLKVLNETHNCWSADCESDSKELLDAVKKWIDLAPTSSEAGISTNSLSFPSDQGALPAQTEFGTLLLQAEQDDYRNEVVEGRFSDMQDSNALEGKYLQLTPVEPNPITNASRSISIDVAKFNDCREFTEADLAPATRALKFMQQRVHIPSGINNGQGKTVQDGYRPFTTSFSFQVIRPEKRLEYARMLYNGEYSSAMSVVFTNGAPAKETNKVSGQKLPDSFQGTALTTKSGVRVLPHFVDWSTVFNSDGSYKTSGNYTKDDGTQESLYSLFKEGSYAPSDDIIHRNFKTASHLKKDILYVQYKQTIMDMFYENSTTRRKSYKYPYNNFINVDVDTYFVPTVSVELRCPQGEVCDRPDFLKYHVVTQSGTPLTQSNALKCYTLNSSLTQLVAANASSCNGNNPKFFHYIDLFVRPIIDSPFLTGAQTVNYYTSSSPNNFMDVESFSEDVSKRQIYHANQGAQEIDPDVFFGGRDALVSETDNLANFSTTLHNVLKTTRCIDCHGNAQFVTAPQFVSPNAASSLAVLESGGLINFDTPSASFRPNGMVHNCNGSSSDPRYSCSDTAEEALRRKLVSGINSWREANMQSLLESGAKPYKNLSRDERLPGRAKYTFKVTTAGLYNVWLKTKNSRDGSTIHFRILNSSGTPIPYSVGSANSPGKETCYKWKPSTTVDFWDWSTPGREAELPVLDQRGYLLLDDKKQPLTMPDKRAYFNLSEGSYTLDVIGLSEGMKLDAVGINRVVDKNTDSRLDFQPDRRAIDEKNISDYRRRVLRFDLSAKLGLSQGKSAHFEIEVKKQFGNQNYIFRNPRFVTSPRTFNLSLKGIKVFINGKWNYPDATYKDLELITGDGRVLTYAPLVALVAGADDLIHFQFDKLAVTTEGPSPLYPKGDMTAPIEDRRCADLDYFIKNVKPILFNVKLNLNDEIKMLMKNFPGNPKQLTAMPEVYNCISCHTQGHPYFKMSTFTNNEELCREALSRVDFQNFYQSLVIRGINGTGNHPKFVFIEKFVNGSDDNFKIHDQAQDYMHNRYRSPSGIASNLVPGPRMVWSKEDMGITKSSYTDLTAQEKLKIAKVGQFRKLSHRKINMDIVNYPWYSADVHYNLLYRTDNSELDNILSAWDVISPDPAIGKLELKRDRYPLIFDVDDLDANGIPITARLDPRDPIPLKGSTKSYIANGVKGFDPESIDYMSVSPAIDTEAQMWADYETQRDFYREKVINWIRRENEARLKGN